MSFFVSEVYAQGEAAAPGGAPPGGDFSFLFFMIVMFAILWFVGIRPQQKRAKEHKTMVDALAKGDEVVTNGGLLGRINKVDEHFISLEVADGMEVRVQRHAVSALMPKGTMKAEGATGGAGGKAKGKPKTESKD